MEKLNQLQKQQEPETAPSPASLLEIAVKKGADIEQLERLLAMQLNYEKNEAKKAYHKAMAGFKSQPPVIEKDQTVTHSGMSYKHASLSNVTSLINAALSNFNLSASWTTKQEHGQVFVTCTITHELGHSESTTLSSEPDTSGKKNNIQSLGSAVTYLQRYTILALTGLATKDSDDDGQNAQVNATIKDTQRVELLRLLTKKGVGVDQVYSLFSITDLNDLKIKDFEKALRNLSVMPDYKGDEK